MARSAATNPSPWSMAGAPGTRLCYDCGGRGQCARDCWHREGEGAKGHNGDGKSETGAASDVTNDGWSQVGTSGPGSFATSTVGPSASRLGAQ
eukprot:1158342-Pyramimonas_sp.AAC.1